MNWAAINIQPNAVNHFIFQPKHIKKLSEWFLLVVDEIFIYSKNTNQPKMRKEKSRCLAKNLCFQVNLV